VAQLKISGRILARNSLLNFIGQVVPLLVGVGTIPFIVRGLGTDRFGLLSLAWVILGYFAIFDLGLGRATTKLVAEVLGKGEENQVPRLVWTAVTVQMILGIVGTLALVGITPLLVERILNIPTELVDEAKTTFYILAFSIPVVLVSGSFRGVLEAAQRFDLVNPIKIFTSVLTFLLPLVGLLLGFSLPDIVALILLARFGALVLFTVLDFRLIPELRRYSKSFKFFLRLFSFGGWMTVFNIASIILTYLDRYLISSLLSLTALTYYSVPCEIVTRLWIIPASLNMTLFPAFSALKAMNDKQRLGTLFTRSLKYILLLVGPVILVIGLFAKEILQIWLGADFAAKSTLVLQVLALGGLIDALARAPSVLLQGIGRPDLPTKFRLLVLPIYGSIAWLLVSQWGIIGAALAWTMRVVMEALMLFMAAFKVCGFAPRLLRDSGIALASLTFLLLVCVACGIKVFVKVFSLSAQSLLIMLSLALFAGFCWRYVLDAVDRETIFKAVRLWRRPESTP